MALQPTIDYLIEQVRSKLDLAANEGVDDVKDILPALNRGKDYAFNILARRYKEPLLTYKEVAIEGGVSNYKIPEGAFEDRLLKVDWATVPGSKYDELDRISYRQVQEYETQTTGIPRYYCIMGREWMLVPKPQGGSVRVWYLREPENYVKSLGRITRFTSDPEATISLDYINPNLTTSTHSLGAYLNVIDGKSGEVKCSIQVKTINEEDSQIQLKVVPSRDSVLGRTISSGEDVLDIAPDDHICSIAGTCIPFFQKPLSNFCVEYATAEMKDKLERQGTELAQRVLEKFEKQVERSWVSREVGQRVRRTNQKWAHASGTYFLRTK